MRLRKQLLFLSLVTLALPWVGCQYIREMDGALRQGQTQALQATARAVSARISSDPELIVETAQLAKARSPLYAHTLGTQIWIDGYDDWTTQGYTTRNLNTNTGKTSVVLGVKEETLYVFLQIDTPQVRYFYPSDTSLADTDHILLHLARGPYALFASAPGQLRAIRAKGGTQVGNKHTEHRIKGFWRESSTGYQVEFTLPWHWAKEGIGLDVMDKNSRKTTPSSPPERHNIVAQSASLTRELAVFSSETMKLHLVTPTGYVIADSGALSFEVQNQQNHGLLEWLNSLVLGDKSLPQFNPLFRDGRFISSDIDSTLAGESSQSWHQIDGKPIARAGLPIERGDGTVIGAIIAQQSMASLGGVTTDAFSRLLTYSVLASTFAGLCLVLYATWLSVRIQRLSEAAANAISESGKITEQFPVSKNADEIGELSRSYDQLLSRLREYTNYLRTLSSKLSHELRTPLAIVKSSLDNLEHETLSEQAKTYVERAREGSTRLSGILNAMSAASRVEQAIGISEREIIPCDDLLSSLKAAYEDVYQQVCFRLSIQPDNKGFDIFGSGELLVQALDKLVDNAADFCPPQGLIELGLSRRQNHIVLTVRNEGPPLPSHMHGQLFDSMVSVRDKPQKEEGHHLGLGLYIVRLITDFHHGEALGYNAPDNSGVIFEIRLPAKDQS